MKILQLEINDTKRISAIEISPETGKPVILTGDNANGKSSVLDAIMLALENKGLDDPIRHGRPSAKIRVELGEDKTQYIVERKITKKGSYLDLTTENGIPVPKAQTFLNGLIGNYAFDPLEFTRLKSKEQVEALKAAAGLDFTEVDALRAEHYAERTSVGRDGKEAAALLASLTEPEGDILEEEQSASTLITKLSDMEDKRREAESAHKHRLDVESELAANAKAIAEAEAILKGLRENEADLQGQQKEAQKAEDEKRQAAPSDEEITAVRKSIDELDEVNAKIRNAKRYREIDARVKKLRADYDTLTRRIEEVDLAKAEAIKQADLPLDGLELTDEGVLMNGTFFNQLSTAEQIRVSALVAMSQNPELRIIIIREGALMNRENLKMLTDLANERGYQLWIEKFQEEPSSEGLHIEDGSITHKDGQPV